MKLIHHGGYNDSERDSYKEIIYSNTIQSMRYVRQMPFSVSTKSDKLTSEQFSRLCLSSTLPWLPKMTPDGPQSFPCLPKSKPMFSQGTSQIPFGHYGEILLSKKLCVAPASSSSM